MGIKKDSQKVPNLRFKGFTDDWEQRELGKIVQIRRGLTYKPSDIADVGIRVLRSSNINGDVFSLNTDDVYVNKEAVKIPLLENGDILVTAANGSTKLVGKHAIVSDINNNTVHGGFMLSISTRKNYFINAWMSSFEYRKILSLVQGGNGAIGNLSKPMLESATITLPGDEEQMKLGAFFKTLDDTITLHQRKLDQLNQLKEALLQQMFPGKGETVPKLRFAGFEGDWEQRKLGDYIIPYSETTTINNQYPVFTSSRKGLFFQQDYYNGHQIASEDNTGYNIVPRGYFTYRHMSDDLVFKFNINNLADYGIVSTLYPVFTTSEDLDSEYLKYQLNEGREFKQFAILQKQGGSRTYMYLSKLQNLKLSIPNIEEQQKISQYFKKLDTTIAIQQRKLEQLKNMKQVLLQNMFI